MTARERTARQRNNTMPEIYSFAENQNAKVSTKGVGRKKSMNLRMQNEAIRISTASEEERQTLAMRFNSAFYLCKKEGPFADFSSILALQEKNGVQFTESYRSDRACGIFSDCIGETLKAPLCQAVTEANYFALLSDGSTDKGIVENELVYVLYLNEAGRVSVQFMSLEKPKDDESKSLLECITNSFEATGITDFRERLYAANIDGPDVNLERQKGVGATLKKDCPWLVLMYSFNHRIELTIKHRIVNTKFDDLNEMLKEVHLVNLQNSTKRLRNVREFEQALEKCFSKETQATGAGWIDYTSQALKWMLDNYGSYVSHVEKLAVGAIKLEKRAELQEFFKRLKEARYPLYIAMYLDVLSLVQRLGVSERYDHNDPVKAVNKIAGFTAAMAKLKAFIDLPVEDETRNESMTHYNKLLKAIRKSNDDTYVYQEIPLKDYETTKESIRGHLKIAVTAIDECITKRFEELNLHPAFRHLVTILDCRKWPTNEDLVSFGDNEIVELLDHFKGILNEDCVKENVSKEWRVLKRHIKPMLEGVTSTHYLDIWEKMLTTERVQQECGSVMHIIELLLITPFTNAPKLQRMFGRLGRVKNDWRNKLPRKQLENLLRIGEDGPNICDFDPNEAIAKWCETLWIEK